MEYYYIGIGVSTSIDVGTNSHKCLSFTFDLFSLVWPRNFDNAAVSSFVSSFIAVKGSSF